MQVDNHEDENYKFILGEDVDTESIQNKNKSIEKLKKYIIFFNKVEQRFKDQPQIYRKVITTIKECKDKNNLSKLYSQITNILQVDQDLIKEFNNLFPSSFLEEYNKNMEKERYKQFDKELDALICSQ